MEKATYPVTILCRVLAVSRSGFYAWSRRPRSARALSDDQLVREICAIHQASRGTYGVPRVRAELAARKKRCGPRRIGRLMRAAGLAGRSRRRSVRTTVTDPTAVPAPNRVARQFYPEGINQLWVGDITYLATNEGWWYVAIVLDAASRRIVGWAMADHLRTELPLAALRMALDQRKRTSGEMVHHSDRGCQYTAAAYQAALTAAGVTPSMSRKGNCWDNAMAESFFATLKKELGDVWTTRKDARRAVFEWIEVFYNRQRRHSGLRYLSPVEFERHLEAGHASPKTVHGMG